MKSRISRKPSSPVFRPRSSNLALETRTLFDGAIAANAEQAAENVDTQHHATDTSDNHDTVEPAVALDGREPARREILFVDTNVTDWQTIVSNVRGDIEVVLLDPGTDALTQIAAALGNGEKTDAIHIVSYGSEGSLQLGGTTISLDTLPGQASQLASIGAGLTADADILLYGCNIASGSAGEDFLQALAQATRADIAASTDTTGAQARGGDWQLERQAGAIETTYIEVESFSGLLDNTAPSLTDSTSSRSTAEDTAISITGIALTDPDAGNSQTVNITSANGTITLATTTGLSTLTGNGTASISFVGSAANATAAMNGMAFTPTANFNGTASFAVTTNDGTAGTVSLGTRNITVNAVNDSPTITDAVSTRAATEDNPLTITGITLADVDSDNSQTVSISAVNGTIKLAGTTGLSSVTGDGTTVISFVGSAADATAAMNGMVFTPDRDFSGTASFSISTNDGIAAQVDLGTRNINVAANATAPTLVLPTGALAATEDLASYLNLSTLELSDPDTNDQLTVTLTVAHGLLTINDSISGGLTSAGISGNGTPTVTLSGTAAAIKASLVAATGVRYVPDADFNSINSGTSEALQFSIADGVEAHAVSSSLEIKVSPVNDPVIVNNGSQSITEGSTTAINATTALVANDPEISATVPTQNTTQIVYRLTSLPIYGYLALNGNRLGVGSTFTQAQVDSSLVRYTHTEKDSNQNTADSFSVSVNDGATPQGSSDTATVTLNIVPLNQAPTAAGAINASVFEGQPRNATTDGVPQSIVGNFINASGGGDPGDSVLNVRLTRLTTHGTLYFSGTAVIDGVSQTINRELNAGDLVGSGFVFAYADRAGLSYGNDGDDGNLTDSFDITVTDGGGGTGTPLSTSTTIDFAIRQVNDDPAFSGSLTATVAANGPDATPGNADDYRVVLTTSMLGATDVDSPDTQITFTITETPASGNLRFNDTTKLIAGSTFTMDDIVMGRITYGQTQAAGPGETDLFKFRVTDNALSLRWDTNGEDFSRLGGVYAGPSSTDSLDVKTFSINLAEVPEAPVNNDASPALSVPAPGKDGSAVEYVGLNPNGSAVGTLLEGGSATLSNSGTVMLRYIVDDVPTDQIVYTITSFGGTTTGWNGTLALSGNTLGRYDTFTQADVDAGRVSFEHDGDSEDFESTFSFKVTAGGIGTDGSVKSTDGTFTFYITPVNDNPGASGSTTSIIREGGTLNITTPQLSFSDPDDEVSESYLENDPAISDGIGSNFALNNGSFGGSPLQFRISQLPAYGSLQWNDAGTWTDIVADDVTHQTRFNASLITGSTASTGLRYVHDDNEEREDSFKVIAIDRWNAESSEATVGITVTNDNDAPQIASDPTQADPPLVSGSSPNNIGPAGNTGAAATNNPLLVVREGGFSQITSAMLQAYDPDSTSQQVQYSITTNTTKGRIAYSTDGINFSTIGAGSSFSQQQVELGYIYYINNGDDPTSTGYSNTPDDKFVFTLGDGDKEQPGAEFWIYVKPTNDAPTVSAPTGPIDLNGITAAVPGFVISDPDLLVVDPQEQNAIQVTIRLLQTNGTPFATSDYTASGGLSIGYTTSGAAAGVSADSDKDGVSDYLVLRGTQEQINAALAGLTVSFNEDRDATYRVEVIVDDRLRDASGAFMDNPLSSETSLPEANGGAVNQNPTPSVGAQTLAIPSTEPDYYSATDFSALSGNVSKANVTIRASSENDPVVVSGPASVTTYEDQTTFIGGSFVVTDAESTAFDLPITVMLSVAQGSLGIGGAGSQSTVTLSGQQAVTVSGDNTGTLALTGRASDIQALLNDSTKGLTFAGPSNGNHDYNGASDGDVTLTVSANDGAAALGATATTASANVAITIDPVNDAPGVTAGAGTVAIVSGPTAVSGFVITDIDNTDGGALNATAGETDFVQATIRLLPATGTTPLTELQHGELVFSSSSAPTDDGTTFRIDTTYTGNNAALVIRGTLANVNQYLAGLQVEITGSLVNTNTLYRVQVVADDRLRNVDTGTLIGSANGGLNTDGADADTLPDAVPTTAIDPYAAIAAGLTLNTASNTRSILPSSVNDPANITVSPVSVNEGWTTVVLNTTLGNITIADPDDAGASNMTATVTVPTGFAISAVGGSGGSVSGTGTTSITITGTEAQINSRLQALTIALPGNSPLWNGNFDVTVVYNDQGNTGVRPGSLVGDSDDPRSTNGDYAYVDAGNALQTTRTFAITVVGVNNAPVRTGGDTVTLPTTTEDIAGGDGSTPAGDTVMALFGSKFSDAADDVSGGSSAGSFAGIAVTTDTSTVAQGNWQYSSNGTNWTNLPAVSNGNALLLKQSDHLRFVPASNFNGVPGSLTVRLVDSSASFSTGNTADLSDDTSKSGGSTAYSDSSNAVTLTTSVAAVNDAPTATNTIVNLASIPEDTPSAVSTNTLTSLLTSRYSDATDTVTTAESGGSTASGFAGAAIIGNAANAAQGDWQYWNGSAWTTIPTTVADSGALVLAASTEIRFSPATDFTGTPGGLTVRLSDGTGFVASTGVGDLKDVSGSNNGGTTGWSAGTVPLAISVLPRNDAPTITGTSAANPTATENGLTGSAVSVDGVSLLTGAATLSDIDLSTTSGLDANIFGAGTITVTLSDGISGDQIFVNGGALAGISTTAGGTGSTPLVITLANTATRTQVEDILAALQYKSSSDNPTVNNTDTTRSYTIVVSDGNNQQAGGNAGGPSALSATPITGTITITPTNDAPVVDLNGATAGVDHTVTWNEAANVTHVAVNIAPSATLSDADNTQLTQMTLIVGNVLDGNSEVLTIGGTAFALGTTANNVDIGAFLVSYDSSTGTFTVTPDGSAVATRSSFQTLLRGTTYNNITDNPTAGDRTIDVQVRDAGHNNAGGTGQLDSNLPRTTITVVPTNDQPVISGLGPLTVFENAVNASPATIDSNITLTDIDSADYNGGTLTVSGLVASQDVVSLPTGAAATLGNVQINAGNVEYHDGSNWVVIGTHSGGNGISFVVSFNANATTAIVERVVENLTYANTSNAPTTTRTLTIGINDGDGNAVQNATSLVTVVRDNDAPTMSATTLGGTYTENGTSLAIVSGTINVADPDAPTNFYNSGANIGSLVVALGAYTSGDQLSVLHQGSAAGQIGVSGNTISYGGTAFATTNGSGNGTDLTITFNSNTATPAAIQALLGRLRYSSSSNDPTVDGTRTSRAFTVTLKDGANTKDATSSTGELTAQLAGTITVQAAIDAPTFSAAPGTAAAWTENTTAVAVDAAFTVSDTDDTAFASASVSIGTGFTSGDALAVNVGSTGITASYNATDGVLTLGGPDTTARTIANLNTVLRSLTFSSSSDDPTVNATRLSRTLTYSVTDANSDGAGPGTNTTTRSVNVSPAQDAPVLGGAGNTRAFTENSTTAITLESGLTLTDVDDTQMNGATVRISSGLTDGDLLAATTTGNISAAYNAGTGVLTLSGTDSIANYLSVLQSVTFKSTSEDPTASSTNRTITWQVTDANSDLAGAASSNQPTTAVTITPLTDAPTFSAAPGTAAAWTENTAAVAVDSGFTVSDTDDTAFASATVSIGSNFTTGDTLAVTVVGGITASYDASSGVMSLTGGTIANLNTVLQSLTFSSTSDDPTVNATRLSRTLTYSVTDANSDGAGAGTSTTTRTVNVSPAQDAPVLGGAGNTRSFTENSATAVILESGLTLTDADDTQMNGATVRISSGLTDGDILAATTTGSISAAYDAGTGILTLTGTDTIANYLSVLQSVTFKSTSEDPTATSSSRTISWQVTDANSDLAGAASSNQPTTTVTITPLTDAPTFSAAPVTAAAWTENTAAVAVDAAFTVSDTDDTAFASATVSIGTGFTPGDVLAVNVGSTGIVASYAADTGTLSLTGGTIANLNTVLQSLTFSSTSDDPTANTTAPTRTLTYSVTDANSDGAGAGTATTTRAINVSPAQDAPVLGGAGNTRAFTENSATAVTLESGLTLTDADDTQMNGATVRISAGLTDGDILAATTTGSISAAYDAGTGILTLTGTDTIANYLSVLQSVTFKSTSEDPTATNASRTISWQVTDANSDLAGAASSSQPTTTVTITPLTDAPTFSAAPVTAAAWTENTAAVAVDAAFTVSDTDDTAFASATVSIGTGFTPGDVLAVNVGSTGIVASYAADTGTLSLTGGTIANLNTVLQSLTFSSTSDDPTVNATRLSRTLTYSVTDANSDGAGPGTNTTTRSVNVSPAQDAPVLGVAGTDRGFTENGTAVTLEPSLTLTDADDTQMVGATVTISSGLTTGDVLAANTVGTNISALYSGGTLTLTGTDSKENYQLVLRSVTFANTSEDPTAGNNASRTITWQVTDANSDGTGEASSNQPTTTVSVTAVNDAPVAVNDSNEITEDAVPATVSGDLTPGTPGQDSDVDSADILSISSFRTGAETDVSGKVGSVGGAALNGSYGTLSVTGSGEYIYSLDNDNPTVNALKAGETLEDVFTYTLSDGNGGTDQAELRITIRGTTDGTASITPVDGNGTADGQASVSEAGLTSVVDTSETTTGTIILGALDGLTSLTVGGRTLDRAELAALGTSSIDIDTGEGTLTLTNYVSTGEIGGITTGGTLSYSYTLKNNLDHTGASGSIDTIALALVDEGDGTASSTLTISIADDQPTANNDARTVTEGSTTAASIVTGNVFAGDANGGVTDRIGADVPLAPVSSVTFGAVTVSPGDSLNGAYGRLNLNDDGSYSYELDNTLPAVDSLRAGDTLTEVFSYTITDNDGDTSTANLTVSINGLNDAPTGADKTLVIDEDIPVTITAADFGFSDVDVGGPDGDFKAVRIDALPGVGTLLLNGVPVADGQVISRADVDAGLLRYAPPENASGIDHARFEFSVQDGGDLFDPAPNVIQFNITPVSDAPTLNTPTADGSILPYGDPIPLSISIAATDTVGTPEVLAVRISAIPPGATLSNAAGDVLTVTDGSITLTPEQLAGLEILIAPTQQTDFSLEVVGISTDDAAVPATTPGTLLVKIPLLPPTNAPGSVELSVASERGSINPPYTTHMPHIWEYGGSFNRIINLPIPQQPAVFVEITVQHEHSMRDEADALAEGSDVSAVLPRETSISPNGNRLGFDPSIFVRPAVLAAESARMYLQGVVLGRDGRTSLSTDSLLTHQGIFAPNPAAEMGMLLESADDSAATDKDQAEADTIAVAAPQPAAIDAKPTENSIRGASAFSEQLRNAQKSGLRAGNGRDAAEHSAKDASAPRSPFKSAIAAAKHNATI